MPSVRGPQRERVASWGTCRIVAASDIAGGSVQPTVSGVRFASTESPTIRPAARTRASGYLDDRA
jgi:hypothetical protein